jgi:hypothetical protein
MLLSYPLDWSQVDGASGDNPFHYPLTGGVAWVLVVLSGALALLVIRGLEPAVCLPAAGSAVTAGLAAVLLTGQLIAGGRTIHQGTTIEVERGPGMWGALIAALVSCAGAALMWRARPRADGAGVRGRRRSPP